MTTRRVSAGARLRRL